MKSKSVYLGLGSNIEDRMEHMRDAVNRIEKTEGISIVKLSPVYQTEPVGYVAQEDFFNMVIEIETTLYPSELLTTVKQIERELGRMESVHKGPRIMDIDILLYGDEIIDEYRLTVPHPRMLSREFVLRPLFDIAPDLRIEKFGVAVRDALAQIEGEKRVVMLEERVELNEVADG